MYIDGFESCIRPMGHIEASDGTCRENMNNMWSGLAVTNKLVS